MSKPGARVGWELMQERAPSLCAHWMPVNSGHAMTNLCWCKPAIQNEVSTQPPYTVVHHNNLVSA